jgi:hypothetical protein
MDWSKLFLEARGKLSQREAARNFQTMPPVWTSCSALVIPATSASAVTRTASIASPSAAADEYFMSGN